MTMVSSADFFILSMSFLTVFCLFIMIKVNYSKGKINGRWNNAQLAYSPNLKLSFSAGVLRSFKLIGCCIWPIVTFFYADARQQMADLAQQIIDALPDRIKFKQSSSPMETDIPSPNVEMQDICDCDPSHSDFTNYR